MDGVLLVTLPALLQQLLNGLTIGMVYVLLVAGLSIIFGVMDVINFAHGELFALGAFIAFALVSAGVGFWPALVLAPLALAVIAALVELGTIRPLYGRNPLYHILLTFGLVLIFKDVIEFIWGPAPKQLGRPEMLTGPVTIAGFSYAKYSYFVLAVGTVLALGTWVALNYTRVGLVVRAGSMDREMVRFLGIDIDRYYTLVFAYGAALAAVGGIVLAGRQSVDPVMGDAVIIPAFVIVVIGGLGSFRGAVAGGLGVGVIQTLMRSFLPQLEGLVVFLLMIAVLLVRPQGLFGAPEIGAEAGRLLTAGGGVLDGPTRRRIGLLTVVGLALAPLGIGVLYSPYTVNFLLINTLVWALFALSLDFVMGYAGLVSLGHVLFYGVGAYVSTLVALFVFPSMLLALAVGVLVCVPIAWAIGYLSIRVAGVYFAMITLAFAELFAELPFKIPLLNGENGLTADFHYLGVGPEVGRVQLLGEITLFYFVVLALVVGSYLIARQLMGAPFGSVLVSIRESESRAQFVGYDVTRYKRQAFVVSGALAGLAGGLQAISTGLVAPNFLAWIKSGELIVMTLLGGMGTLYGPMFGAGLFLGIKELLLTAGIEQWQGVLGLLFVGFVIFVPRGLVSIPAVLAEWYESESGGGRRDEGPEVEAD